MSCAALPCDCVPLVIHMCGCWRILCGRPYRTRTSGQLDLTGQFEACFILVQLMFFLEQLTRLFHNFCVFGISLMINESLRVLWFVILRLMPIQQCELVLVHVYPQGDDTLVSDRSKKEVGPIICTVSTTGSIRYLGFSQPAHGVIHNIW